MVARFPIRFEAWYRLLSSALWLRPTDSYVDVNDDTVVARMGWAFSAHFPRSCVASAARLTKAPLSLGVHGYAGRWLVNGSGDQILALDLKPPQRARVIGFPVRLERLMVSVDDCDGLAKLLTVPK